MSTLPLTIPATVTYENLLAKVVEKHHRFNKGIIKHDRKSSYDIFYGDKSRATYLPGCNEPFTLKRYKKEIDKPYMRITLRLSSDHFTSIWNNFDHDYDTEESCSDTNSGADMCRFYPELFIFGYKHQTFWNDRF